MADDEPVETRREKLEKKLAKLEAKARKKREKLEAKAAREPVVKERPGKSHAHLCKRAKLGVDAEFERLTSPPRFICLKCGRVAAAGEDLCRPKPLDAQLEP
ncbi:MAG: hypothetical protein ACTSU5_11170 [Promethearchaeota archaeon]